MVSIEDIIKQSSEGLLFDDEDPSTESLQHLLRNRTVHEQEADMEVIDFLNANFDSVESLENIDKTLGGLDKSLLSIDEKLRESIRE